MNERIKELAKKAGGHPNYRAYRGHFLPPPPDYIDPATIDLEKFAKLIVKECCLYLENEAERLYGISASEVDPIFQSNFELCAEKCYDNSDGLKEHFGIEE